MVEADGKQAGVNDPEQNQQNMGKTDENLLDDEEARQAEELKKLEQELEMGESK